MIRTLFRTLISLATILFLSTGVRAGEITMEKLLDDMTNLAAMAEFPDPAYVTKLFSSYERTSTTPENKETWFANDDCGVYLRVEDHDGRKEFVMADMQGPGAIVRMWSASPLEGVIRIYIDGAERPALEASCKDLLSGKFPNLPSPIACVVSKGWNLYFPIPYAKSCKVTCDRGGQYYQVNYRTYPAGTAVTSFTLDQLEAAKDKVAAVADKLADPKAIVKAPDGAGIKQVNMTIPPDKSINLTKGEGGPGTVVELKVWADVPADKREETLRAMVLKMTFDGEQTVEVPLGDFFGAAPGVNPYASLPLGVEEDGTMWCHWPMPFEKTVDIILENHSKLPVPLKSEAAIAHREWTKTSMHFHAGWRIDFDVPTRPMRDWNYLNVTGKGVFTGVALYLDNPVMPWWGEGDEKIYVDGENFPSHFGTGTEDYYGYANGCAEVFFHAYHNQPRCDGPGAYGRTSLNRFNILDCIPFEKR